MNARELIAALGPCAGHVLHLSGSAVEETVMCREVMHLRPDQRVSDEAGNVLLYNGFHWMGGGGSPCGLSIQAGDVQDVRWLRHEGQVIGLLQGRETTVTAVRIGKIAAS
jgi:hypothetical protein